MAGLCRDASLGGQREFLRVGREQLSNATSETVVIVTPRVNLSGEVKSATWIRHFTRPALASAGLLLLSNLPFIPIPLHAYLSALPLALAGLAYAMLQFRVRPARETLLKRLLLAATFMVWAVDQLLSSGCAAAFIGDVVIAAYVLDLHWLIQEQLAANDSKPFETNSWDAGYFVRSYSLQPMAQPFHACNLNAFSVDERTRHTALTEQLHSAIVEKREFDEGFAFRISSSQLPPSRIVEWIILEQRCCPFVTFELRFEADQGPVWLHLSGDRSVKNIIRHELHRLIE